MSFLPVWCYVEKYYPVDDYVSLAHTRRRIVQAVSVSNLDRLYQQIQMPALAFPHVTLFVGTDTPEELTAFHGISICSLNDSALIIKSINPKSHGRTK